MATVSEHSMGQVAVSKWYHQLHQQNPKIILWMTTMNQLHVIWINEDMVVPVYSKMKNNGIQLADVIDKQTGWAAISTVSSPTTLYKHGTSKS